MKIILFLCFVSFLGLSSACRYETTLGHWTIYETERTGDHTLPCDSMGPVVHTKIFELQFPNTVVDELGNYGTWTMIIANGFEVNINERSYFGFFAYDSTSMNCGQTFTSKSRDRTVRHWSCYYAQKTSKVSQRVIPRISTPIPKGKYVNNHEFIKKINSIQSSWKAKAYPEHEKYTYEEMVNRAGGPTRRGIELPPTAPVTKEQKAKVSPLPASFDWRNVAGVNYVSPVRDQEQCGSCYAFSSMGSLEARLRITTKNQRQDFFSVQDIVECTNLSNGCGGGWPYLIGGRYSEEQGVVAESCNPYEGTDGACTTDMSCDRTYVSEYQYVGGFYGGCNEELMKEAIVTGGPIVVLYMVYSDFYSYEGGVYKHTQLTDVKFRPYERVSHAVLAVGYGTEESTGEKYWIIKNSWGDWWGENGYFRILRGTDECSIESAGFSPTPIP